MTGDETSRIIDWDEVRKRVEKARATAEQGWVPGPEERKKILKTRARALAGEPEADAGGEKIEVIEFLLAYEKYAVETSSVREVYPLKDLTPVPCTPAHVLGIINVRGQILSIVDLKKFFDLPEKGLGELNKVIILKSDSMEFGVLADAILGVRSVLVSGLQTGLPTLTGVREEYLRGVTADRTAVLDAGRILADKKIVVDEEAV
jgi:purine-binding chemotaxis protein CheW